MFLRVLGSLVVEAGSPPTPIAVPGAKERALLGRLLISPGQTVSVDLLIEDLWEGAAPPTARKSLQAHVVPLRTALEPDRPAGSPGRFVVHRGRGYALAVPADAVDASVVLVDAAIGRAALDGGDPERARARFGAALAYWHGEAFEDWRDAGWARGERQRLAEVKAAILKARIDTDLESGRHRDLVPELEGLVAAEPLHEGWWARLMLALYRSGRQGDALAVARRAPRRPAEDLGVDPGPVLAQMEQSILAQAESFQPAVPRRKRTADPPNGSEAAGSASRGCPYRGLAAVTSRVRRRPTSRWGVWTLGDFVVSTA